MPLDSSTVNKSFLNLLPNWDIRIRCLMVRTIHFLHDRIESLDGRIMLSGPGMSIDLAAFQSGLDADCRSWESRDPRVVRGHC